MAIIFKLTGPPAVAAITAREIKICNGSNIFTFDTIVYQPETGALEVFVNGALCYPELDYIENGPQEITFHNGKVENGDIILVIARG